MFWHNFKYELISGLRVKDVIIWLIIFPIILGGFFKIAFSSIYEKTTEFSAIPVAVTETEKNEVFHKVMSQISEGDDALFKVTYAEKNEAVKMLDKKEVYGIIFTDGEISLSVSDNGIEQTIIKTFVEQYIRQEKIIKDTAMNHPDKLNEVILSLGSNVSANKNIPLTNGNTDYCIAYFYNLIAMVALFGSITGLHISISNQGNLSSLGARKCCSPTPKSISLLAGLMGSYILQIICIIISITYVAFVLRIDFGNRLPLVYISGIIGSLMGVSLGFAVGSFGRMSTKAKEGVAMSVSMLSCFFSGLMVGNMKAIIAEKAPWFNEINPASLISDAFYCLNIYDDYDRYIQKNITMIILAVIFVVIGFMLTRRRKYASL